MSACVQISKTKLDWLVGISHGRFSGLISPSARYHFFHGIKADNGG
jgi:hypothetical protein